MRRQCISAQELTELSTELSQKVLESGFHPTFIVALWRGGAYTGTVIQEHLAWHNVKTDHIAIRTNVSCTTHS
jgi:hypoxanthine phosphoribosyltransferase